MADLPVNRIERALPFQNSGVEVFGPFVVHDGKTTRNSKASKKGMGFNLCLYGLKGCAFRVTKYSRYKLDATCPAKVPLSSGDPLL